MMEENREVFFDLLTKKAVYGLDEAEQQELDSLDNGFADAEFHSLEITAAAIGMAGLDIDEPMPAHLFAKIADDARQYVGADKAIDDTPIAAASDRAPVFTSDNVKGGGPGSWFGWLGWAVAAAACIMLALNIWSTRINPPDQANVKPPVDIPQAKSPAQLREEMMSSTTGMIKADWTVATPKDTTPISGDIVWSDEKQAGYMRFRGLPVNDARRETYQLWIFDKTQDKATPIDGGTFDVSSDGEVVIPINAKLRALGPEMFAITVERPGGVVVSKREKIAAIAKVAALTRSST